MLPPDKSLDARVRTGAQVDLGLVVEAELAGADRVAQLVAGLDPGERAGADVVVEHLEPVTAALFGAVHRRVGIAQQLVGCPAPFDMMTPMLAVSEISALADLERGGEQSLDASGDRDRFGLAGELRAHHDELVAADPGDGVAGPGRLDEACRETLEQFIAGVVPVDVVDGLEVVEVEVQHANGCRVTRRLREGAGRETVEEQRAVGQTRELVVEREVLQLRLIGEALGDVDGERETASRPRNLIECDVISTEISPPSSVTWRHGPEWCSGPSHAGVMQPFELVQLGAALASVARRHDVADPHVQELCARIAVVGDRPHR